MTQEYSLRPQLEALLDGESNQITQDITYAITGKALDSSIRQIKKIHGSGVKFLPMSGQSAGGGVFQVPCSTDETIVGLHIAPAVAPKIRCATQVNITRLALDEIVINESKNSIYAGAAVTLQQLNQALADKLGAQYMVLGADLTSYTYAQVGSTFMTGGMGPQRRYFSDSVVEIVLYDGDKFITISEDKLVNYAQTYGWTGLVSAVQCKYHQLPDQEFAFSIPVKNNADSIARLLNHLSRFTYLETVEETKVQSRKGTSSLVLGLEHITVDSMQPLLNLQQNTTASNISREIVENCNSANADGVVFVYGLSELPVDEIIEELVDDVSSSTLTIADIDLEHTYYFSDLNRMRDVREAVSYAARNQEPKGTYSYKGHTDANIWINPDELGSSVKEIWQAYLYYIESVETYFKSQPLLKGEILIYGHLNPVGIDPHNRITLATENESVYHAAIGALDELKHTLIIRLASICENSGAFFSGGEKGVGSDHEILLAFDSLEAVPTSIAEKFVRQASTIKNSSPCFNWRAFKPYI